MSAQEISPNTFKVLAFSLSSATISAGNGVIMNLPIFIESSVSNGVYPIAFLNEIISDTNNIDVSTPAAVVGEITINTLGIDDFTSSDNALKFYPNPVSDNLNIISTLDGDFNIYDINGKIILKTTIDAYNTTNRIDVKNLITGIYLVQLNNNSQTVSKQILIK